MHYGETDITPVNRRWTSPPTEAITQAELKSTALEGKVGYLTMESGLLKGGGRPPDEQRALIDHFRVGGNPVSRGLA
jgi:hypothetical protein